MSNSEKKLLLGFTSLSSSDSDVEEQEEVALVEAEVVVEEDEKCDETTTTTTIIPNMNNRKRLLFSRQLSMRETTREAKWENRRMQIFNRRRMMMTTSQGGGEMHEDHNHDDSNSININEEEEMMRRERERERGRVRSLTDEDLDELRGSIELGFGFNEEDGGHNLCDTLPALNLYFAVNRQLSDPKLRSSPSPASTPTAEEMLGCGSPTPSSPMEEHNGPDWKICNPGDNPQHVKTRLRHWAQAVACSVRQCC